MRTCQSTSAERGMYEDVPESSAERGVYEDVTEY